MKYTPNCGLPDDTGSIIVAMRALDSAALRELRAEIHRAAAAARVIVLSAAGLQTGFDLAEVCAAAASSNLTPARLFVDCLLAIREARVPVIACVDGKTMGGSVGLIAACDIVIAGSRAVFQLPEVIAGMIPALVGPVLTTRITPARARYLALSSRAIDAREAHVIGLVDEVADTSLEDCLQRQVSRILRSSPEALAECKRKDPKPNGQSFRQEMETSITWLANWLAKPSVRQGVAEFANGFAPAWFSAGKE